MYHIVMCRGHDYNAGGLGAPKKVRYIAVGRKESAHASLGIKLRKGATRVEATQPKVSNIQHSSSAEESLGFDSQNGFFQSHSELKLERHPNHSQPRVVKLGTHRSPPKPTHHAIQRSSRRLLGQISPAAPRLDPGGFARLGI